MIRLSVFHSCTICVLRYLNTTCPAGYVLFLRIAHEASPPHYPGGSPVSHAVVDIRTTWYNYNLEYCYDTTTVLPLLYIFSWTMWNTGAFCPTSIKRTFSTLYSTCIEFYFILSLYEKAVLVLMVALLVGKLLIDGSSACFWTAHSFPAPLPPAGEVIDPLRGHRQLIGTVDKNPRHVPV